jgi:nicotinamide mononucleotide adenylyltransferase
MKYILRWDDEKFNYRYWTGFGGGFSRNPLNAKVFGTMKHAEIESDAIFASQRRGTQIRPLDNITRRDYARKSMYG